MKYEIPNMELLFFEVTDIVRTSNPEYDSSPGSGTTVEDKTEDGWT